MIQKRSLQTFQKRPASGETLDGGDIATIRLTGSYQAGAYRIAVQQNRTCAAISRVAADFRSCKPEVFTEHARESTFRRRGYRLQLPIDTETDCGSYGGELFISGGHVSTLPRIEQGHGEPGSMQNRNDTRHWREHRQSVKVV